MSDLPGKPSKHTRRLPPRLVKAGYTIRELETPIALARSSVAPGGMQRTKPYYMLISPSGVSVAGSPKLATVLEDADGVDVESVTFRHNPIQEDDGVYSWSGKATLDAYARPADETADALAGYVYDEEEDEYEEGEEGLSAEFRSQMDPDANGDVLFIDLLEIEKSKRRKGLGRKIVEELFQHARARGLRDAWIYACHPDGSDASVAFWERIGFQRVSGTAWGCEVMRMRLDDRRENPANIDERPVGTVRYLGTSDDVTTCDCCGRSDLKSTVALSIDDGDPVYYGVVCAARALRVSSKEVRKGAKDADDARYRAEQAAKQAKERAAFEHWDAWLKTHAPSGTDVFTRIQSLGGFAAARAAYEGEHPERARSKNPTTTKAMIMRSLPPSRSLSRRSNPAAVGMDRAGNEYFVMESILGAGTSDPESEWLVTKLTPDGHITTLKSHYEDKGDAMMLARELSKNRNYTDARAIVAAHRAGRGAKRLGGKLAAGTKSLYEKTKAAIEKRRRANPTDEYEDEDCESCGEVDRDDNPVGERWLEVWRDDQGDRKWIVSLEGGEESDFQAVVDTGEEANMIAKKIAKRMGIEYRKRPRSYPLSTQEDDLDADMLALERRGNPARGMVQFGQEVTRGDYRKREAWEREQAHELRMRGGESNEILAQAHEHAADAFASMREGRPMRRGNPVSSGQHGKIMLVTENDIADVCEEHGWSLVYSRENRGMKDIPLRGAIFTDDTHTKAIGRLAFDRKSQRWTVDGPAARAFYMHRLGNPVKRGGGRWQITWSPGHTTLPFGSREEAEAYAREDQTGRIFARHSPNYRIEPLRRTKRELITAIIVLRVPDKYKTKSSDHLFNEAIDRIGEDVKFLSIAKGVSDAALDSGAEGAETWQRWEEPDAADSMYLTFLVVESVPSSMSEEERESSIGNAVEGIWSGSEIRFSSISDGVSREAIAAGADPSSW